MYSNIFYEPFDSEEYDQFISSVEKQFRNSPEYTIWLNSVVEDRGTCRATGYTKDGDGVKIEVHHYRISLWQWVEIIINRFRDNDLYLNSHLICLILSDMHLNNTIPYIPLMHCIHKMLHDTSFEDITMKYPAVIDGIYNGDMDRALQIIDYHIDIVKEILNKEKEGL